MSRAISKNRYKFEKARGSRKINNAGRAPAAFQKWRKLLRADEVLAYKKCKAEYELECSRAELLGFPKPDREEFLCRQRETTREENEKEIQAAEAEDEGVRREGFQRIGGGLEELNSILSSTQKKLNRFKVVCGSFTNLLKLQIGTQKEENQKNCSDTKSCSFESQESGSVAASAAQSTKGGASELDKLESLINKAERAELSLSSQNKQMKKFLN